LLEMARDQMLIEQHRALPPAVLQNAWDVARNAGIWWPFADAVVLAERPAEVLRDAKGMLTLVFGDGWKAEPYSAGQKTAPHRERQKRVKADDILSVELPRDPEARIALLRGRAGRLPLFDRYVAGDYEQVWRELVDLGPEVRAAARAADALAVAYETMRRVGQNVKTIIARLQAIGYAFENQAVRSEVRRRQLAAMFDQASELAGKLETGPGGHGPLQRLQVAFQRMQGPKGMLESLLTAKKRTPKDNTVQAHVSPNAKTLKSILKLERKYGPLPLSLRAFYDLVGEVNLMGYHPAVSPAESSVAPDPLVVYGVESALEEIEGAEYEASEIRVTIAPDYLHKADISGGDPYSIQLPAPTADAPLQAEPHNVDFVEYLRLVFAWGGFPGWQQADAILPAELERLREGLLPI